MKKLFFRTVIGGATLIAVYFILSLPCRFLSSQTGKCWSLLTAETEFIEFSNANNGLGYIAVFLFLLFAGYLIQKI